MTKGQESFAASPIDTARPQETRDSRRDRWEHQNEHFVRDFLPFSHFVASKSIRFPYLRVFLKAYPVVSFTSSTSTFAYLKIDVSCEASVNFQHIAQNATHATEFAPCRHLMQPCQCDWQKTRNTTRPKVLRLPRQMTMDTSKVVRLPRKMQHYLTENVAKVLRLPHKTTFDTSQKHVWMSRSATPATRNETTRRLKPPKMTTSAELTIGNGHTVLTRTVATVNATSSEHTLNSQAPRVKTGNHC